MSYKAIFFDMDGTLLPMDTDKFTKYYFSLLCKKVYPLGVNPDGMVKSLWAGVEAMVRNDGSRMNKDVFWDTFKNYVSVDRNVIEPVCEEFYSVEFRQVKEVLGDNPLAKKAVDLAHEKADLVILATNPLFPFPAQDTRMDFVGLNRNDFDFITAYENSMFAKPNPAYFKWLLDKYELKGEEVLMVGNDEKEDMWAASTVGIDTYLVTDTVIRNEKYPYTGKSGTFVELIEFLNNL